MDISKQAETFKKTLQQIEAQGDPAPLVKLFAEECEVLALVEHRTHSGHDGAAAFWQEYLRQFESIRSEFTHTAADGRLVILEWTATGSLANGGREITYGGCSLLEYGEDGKIRRFRTYYDSAAFLPVEQQS